ncbi:MAG: HAMP domain-containing protein [Acidimicrobiales bacterium]|nr:HAMP domain-containing protein [Acidimicrobiales bacterium]
MIRHLSVKSKLLITVLGVAIISVLVVGVISFQRGQRAISELVEDDLVAQRETRAELIERYLQLVEDQAATLSQDRSMATAAAEFAVAAEQLAGQTPDPVWTESSQTFYEDFLVRLPADARTAELKAEQYIPTDPVAVHLQHFYTIDNAALRRRAIDEADDGSFYSRVHSRYHPSLRTFADRFGYGDIYIIEPNTKRIVYTVEKHVDFATSLSSGPWGRTSLAELVEQVLRNPVPGFVTFSDYGFYRPSLDAPVAFLAAPIFNPVDQSLLGVLAFQIPVDQIDSVMTADGNWEEAGFGETGEAYLVGSDLMMRSQSRLLVEDPTAFRAAIDATGSEDGSDTVASGNTVLRQVVRTAAAQRGLAGEVGIDVIETYHGGVTLSSYGPLDIPAGLDWAIISEQALSEAEAPVNSLQRALLAATGLIVLFLTGLAMPIATRLIRPVTALIEWADGVTKGDLNSEVPVSGRDEVGQLAASIDHMVSGMREQSHIIEAQTAEMQSLILNLMPSQIAERVSKGETNVVDEYPNVAVVVANLSGFSRYARTASVEDAKDLLDEVIGSFDEVAAANGVEKIRGGSSTYIAVCGLLEPRLDQRQRAMQFAVALDAKLEALSKFNDWNLELQIGVASGNVEAGIVGSTQISFEIWGDPVSDAAGLADAAAPGTLLVEKGLADSLAERFSFVPAESLNVDGHFIEAWLWTEEKV